MDGFIKQYFYRKEKTLDEVFERVAFIKANKESGISERIYSYLKKGWFLPSTPILANLGTTRGLPISCFLNEVDDNMQSIIDIGISEVCNLMALGGGVATNWSNIREIGAAISTGGKTSGVIPFIKNQEILAMSISQGGSLRRGNVASYLNISHPEIQEFIAMRKANGGDVNRKILHGHHGVIIDDVFMARVAKKEKYHLISPLTGETVKTVNAFDLWTDILTARIETGEPYILFIDTVNENRCESYKRNDLMVSTSNLCVAPETQILTKKFGWIEIQKVANQDVEIWNGFEWSKVVPRKTGENQKLIKVKFSDGNEIHVTEYHKWFIQEKYGTYNSCVSKKETKDLKIHDRIIKNNFPIMLNGEKDLEFAYANGFFTGDGTQLKCGRQRIYLYHEKRLLKNKIGFDNLRWYVQENQNREFIDLPAGSLQEKFFVPNHEYTIQSRLQWLAGLCDADGTIARNGTNQSLQITSTNRQFLKKIQYMLYTMGCGCKITNGNKGGWRKMPTNNQYREKYKEYFTQPAFRLLIDSNQLYLLTQLGFKTCRLQYTALLPNRAARQFVSVIDIVDENRIDDTYCLTELIRGTVVFNGIITGNCSEIVLTTEDDYQDKKRTAVCCLSSLNLEHFQEFYKDKQFFEDVLTFLDNVLTEFIKKTKMLGKASYIENAIYSAMMERSVGLGVMGFHSHLQQKKIPFDSDEAMLWNQHIFSTIKNRVDEANIILGRRLGANPDCRKALLPHRFSNTMAIAPTASISVIANTSPSIDPITSNIIVQKNKTGTAIIKNKNLEKCLEVYGKNDDETWNSISEHLGSVAHLNFMNKTDKEIFKTAFEISMIRLVEMAAERQKYIDQTQSLNLFFLPNVEKKHFHEVHFLAWKLKVKSLYYVRSLNLGKLLAKKKVICEEEVCTVCQ